MTQVRDSLVRSIYRGKDPFEGIPNDYPLDKQGWRSDHPYLAQGIRQISPRVVVEIGVWKGASVINLAATMRESRLDGVIIAVDTWLGSSEHWAKDDWYSDLRVRNGRPTIQDVFMANILSEGLTEYVLPLPLDSLNAATLLGMKSCSIDLIHLDAGHDRASVHSDLSAWWPLLRDGGMIIGDDYSGGWPGVIAAFDSFFEEIGLTPLEHKSGKCRVIKRQPS